MGMTIDDVILCLKGIKQYGSDTFIKRSQGDWQNSLDIAIDTMHKYQMMQADYENRLKADMVAMLTEIQLEIREYHEIGCDEDCNNCRMVGCVEPVNVIKDLDIIQQKIDALKAESEDKDENKFKIKL